jgi:O-antigen biosynthesis protein
MPAPDTARPRVSVEGKFFRLGDQKFYGKGLAYGPLLPDRQGLPFASPEATARDFGLIRDLGANLLRIYGVPPPWFLELAAQHQLKLIVDVPPPWKAYGCFLDTEATRQALRQAVQQAALACARHPVVLGLSVVNEIPPDVIRWSGASAMADFLDELVALVKAVDPACLCTFGNFPPTEFLQPKSIDFLSYNVYLHDPKQWECYLARLQTRAESKPLLLSEFGIDSGREGEARQAEILTWQTETAFGAGAAGVVIFSFTDEWFKEGQLITDWAFGLTTAQRRPKPAFEAVRRQFRAAPYFPPTAPPKVSVVVATYNGARTLKTCLESLTRLHYPDYEILVVDDGSEDDTAPITAQFPQARCLRHPQNLGLSAARNTGLAAARGTIVAFLDDDCRADEDWLYYLVGDLERGRFAGIGGPNLLPPEDSAVAAAVMASPGGPAPVMLTDRIAEHVPGCNMAFYRQALLEIGGFDPIFRRAGDDVDLCWRLQQGGGRIGFSPAGFVWHFRRSTVRDYLRQQRGYGEAEALLVHKHPEYFNSFGGCLWKGRIYSSAKFGPVFRPARVHHGFFGSGLFPSLYAVQSTLDLTLFTSLEYQILVTLPLLILSVAFSFLTPLALTSVLVSLAVCVAAAMQAEIPKRQNRFSSRPLIACLYFLQPIVRGLARYQGRLVLRPLPLGSRETLDSLSLKRAAQRFDEVQYYAMPGMNRLEYLNHLLKRLDQERWPNRPDSGWNDYDVEITGSRWSRLQLLTVLDTAPDGRSIIRFRLRAVWTLLARTVFGAALGLELLLIGFFGKNHPWLWLLLLSLAGLAWGLHQEKRRLQRLIVVFLDEIAKERALTKVPQ